MLLKRKPKNLMKNLSATLQVEIYPLVNKLEYTDNKRPDVYHVTNGYKSVCQLYLLESAVGKKNSWISYSSTLSYKNHVPINFVIKKKIMSKEWNDYFLCLWYLELIPESLLKGLIYQSLPQIATFSPGLTSKFIFLSTAFARLVSHEISVALIKMDCSSSFSLYFCLAYLFCNFGATRNFKIRVKDTFASMNTLATLGINLISSWTICRLARNFKAVASPKYGN